MTESREDSVYLAKLAEQAERYEGARISNPNGTLDPTAHDDHQQKWSRR